MTRRLRGVGRYLAGILVCLFAVLAGTGWVYALRHSGLLAVGPHLREALPLQRLAGSDAQPLGRLLAVWGVAGIMAGAALGLLRVRGRVVMTGVLTYVALVAASAASDAVSESQGVVAHLPAQYGRASILWATAAVAAGALLGRTLRLPHPRERRSLRQDATNDVLAGRSG